VSSFRVRFLPDRQEISVNDGQTLLDAARQANVYVGAICGGEGTCGKCRLIVREGEVEGESTEFLTREEIRRGYVLACQVVARSDLVVEVPPESRLSGYVGIGGQESDRFRDFTHTPSEVPAPRVDPVVKKVFLTLVEPTLDDPTADQERLLGALARDCDAPLQMGLKVCRQLPQVLRKVVKDRGRPRWQWDGRVTATLGSRGPVIEVLSVESGNTSDRNFGLALDIGTTTVVAHLVDLVTGATREAAAKYNSQLTFGADVIGRINYARQPHGSEDLQRAIVKDVDTLIQDLEMRTKIGRGDIQCIVAAGNTTMLHFLLGLEPDLIRLSPFTPAAVSPPPVRAAEIGIRVNPRAILYALPMIGSFVGGDVTAGIVASGMHLSDELSLLIDLGTNGEIVLGNRDFLVACAASAGPAFEGGSVTCGMRAARGAIDSVEISPRDGRVTVSTIDGGRAVGLCGTGMIDAIAQMFLAGLVDRSGRFQVDRCPDRFQISAEDDRPEFILVPPAEAENPRGIVITQADVENLIRTKGAIYAAAACLVNSVGLSFADIQRLYIAGAFGNKLDVANCVTIGLLPDLPIERIHFIGNSSVAGAKLAMLNEKLMAEMHRIRERVTYEELMVNPRYMDDFLSACFLPHTDLSQFPSVPEPAKIGKPNAGDSEMSSAVGTEPRCEKGGLS
jgi:uncharacterized 2Fe-2S/4Fe-4S cluster protein (DUF4445 family)